MAKAGLGLGIGCFYRYRHTCRIGWARNKMTSLEKLIMMANQIAANQMRQPDPAAATAHHIGLYWDPRMKQLILAHDGAGLSPIAAAAVAQLPEKV